MAQNPRGRPGPPRGPRRPPARVSPATYWRRRVAVLAVGIGLLATVSWAANGMLAARSTAAQAAGSAATKSAGPASGHARGSRAHARPTPSPRPSPAPSRHHSEAASPASGPALACPPGAVTLELSSPQNWYPPGTTPRFTVRAVSAQAQPCRFNMGTGFVSVVITGAGRRIWGSADCLSGGGSKMTVLTRGVPAVLRLSWDRRSSSPGCSGAGQLVPTGEYQAAAVARHLRSATENFVLGAQGASGP